LKEWHVKHLSQEVHTENFYSFLRSSEEEVVVSIYEIIKLIKNCIFPLCLTHTHK